MLPWFFLTLVVPTRTDGPFPDCTDPSTYTVYTKSTQYKGLHNTVSYDDDNTSTGCNLDHGFNKTIIENITCGDCDFEDTPPGVWIRYPEPFSSIFEFGPHVCENSTQWPPIESCNGYSQLALARNNSLVSDDSRCVHFNLVRLNIPIPKDKPKDNNTCQILDDTVLIERYDCDSFFLYKMPNDFYKGTDYFCYKGTVIKDVYYIRKYSFCLVDRQLTPRVVTQDRLYYSGRVDVNLTCVTENSPLPPESASWSGLPAGSITTNNPVQPTPTRRETMVTISRTNTSSVTCSYGDSSATFYRFTMSTYGRTFNSTHDNLQVCVVQTLPHTQLSNDLMLEDPDGKLYTNSTMHTRGGGDEMSVWSAHKGEFSVSLRFSKESLKGMAVHSTASWHCVLWDPILKAEYKGLHNTVSYDSSHDQEYCTLYRDNWTEDTKSDQLSCGNCDFENLPPETWVRFPGLFTEIVTVSSDPECTIPCQREWGTEKDNVSICDPIPSPGSCNGFGQIALTPHHSGDGSFNIVLFEAFFKFTNHTSECIWKNTSDIVSRVVTHDCDEFTLYKIPIDWRELATHCHAHTSQIESHTMEEHWTPMSLCLEKKSTAQHEHGAGAVVYIVLSVVLVVVAVVLLFVKHFGLPSCSRSRLSVQPLVNHEEMAIHDGGHLVEGERGDRQGGTGVEGERGDRQCAMEAEKSGGVGKRQGGECIEVSSGREERGPERSGRISETVSIVPHDTKIARVSC
eukprot:sb/3462438/